VISARTVEINDRDDIIRISVRKWDHRNCGGQTSSAEWQPDFIYGDNARTDVLPGGATVFTDGLDNRQQPFMASKVSNVMTALAQGVGELRFHLAFKSERKKVRLGNSPRAVFSDGGVQILPNVALHLGNGRLFGPVL